MPVLLSTLWLLHSRVLRRTAGHSTGKVKAPKHHASKVLLPPGPAGLQGSARENVATPPQHNGAKIKVPKQHRYDMIVRPG